MDTPPSPDWDPVIGLRELAAISCMQVLMQRDNHPLRDPQGPEELAQEAMIYSDALVRKIVKWQKMRIEGILNR